VGFELMNDRKANKQKNYAENGRTGTYIATKVEEVLQSKDKKFIVTYFTGSAEIWSGTRESNKKNSRGQLVVFEPDTTG